MDVIAVTGVAVRVDAGTGVDVTAGAGVVVVVELPTVTFPLVTVMPVRVTPVWSAISAPVRVIEDCPLTPDLAVI